MTNKRKVVYNACYGGFSLSLAAQELYLKKKCHTPKPHKGKHHWDEHWYIEEPRDFYDVDIKRHDPALVEVVEELGEKSFGRFAKLVIKEVDGPYRIDEYDGMERVVQSYGDWQ